MRNDYDDGNELIIQERKALGHVFENTPDDESVSEQIFFLPLSLMSWPYHGFSQRFLPP